jgi:hypothetical protein
VITYSHILEKSCPELVRSVLDAPLNPDTALEKLRTSMAT